MKGLNAAVILLSTHSFFGCEPSGGYFCEITGNEWFAGPAHFSKSCKKAVKSSISRLFHGGDEEDRTLDLTDANRVPANELGPGKKGAMTEPGLLPD